MNYGVARIKKYFDDLQRQSESVGKYKFIGGKRRLAGDNGTERFGKNNFDEHNRLHGQGDRRRNFFGRNYFIGRGQQKINRNSTRKNRNDFSTISFNSVLDGDRKCNGRAILSQLAGFFGRDERIKKSRTRRPRGTFAEPTFRRRTAESLHSASINKLSRFNFGGRADRKFGRGEPKFGDENFSRIARRRTHDNNRDTFGGSRTGGGALRRD